MLISTKVCLFSVVGLVVGSASLQAQSCSPINAQAFTVTCDGYLSPDGKATMVPTKALAFAYIDRGTVTINGSISIGGQLGGQTASGSITVNPDCTGTMTVQSMVNGAATPTLNFLLLVSQNRNLISAINVDQGNALSCTLVQQPVLNPGGVVPPTPSQITGVPSHPIVTPH